MHRDQPRDRRVEKTERLLREALGSLIHEKRYDAIAVREILERADVGRSAFYAHFADKDALLVASIRHVLSDLPSRPLPPSARRLTPFVGFSHGLFEHIERVRHTGTAMKGKQGRAIVHHHLRHVLLEALTEAFTRTPLPGSNRIPPGVLAEHVISTFLVVVNWWVDSDSRLSAREADDMFLALVLPTLGSMLDAH